MGCWSVLYLTVTNKHHNGNTSPQEPHCGEVILAGCSYIFGHQSLIRDWLGQPEADVEELGEQNLHKSRRDRKPEWECVQKGQESLFSECACRLDTVFRLLYIEDVGPGCTAANWLAGFTPNVGHMKRQRVKKIKRSCPTNCGLQPGLPRGFLWVGSVLLYMPCTQKPVAGRSLCCVQTHCQQPSPHSSFLCTQINAHTLPTESSHPSQQWQHLWHH